MSKRCIRNYPSPKSDTDQPSKPGYAFTHFKLIHALLLLSESPNSTLIDFVPRKGHDQSSLVKCFGTVSFQGPQLCNPNAVCISNVQWRKITLWIKPFRYPAALKLCFFEGPLTDHHHWCMYVPPTSSSLCDKSATHNTDKWRKFTVSSWSPSTGAFDTTAFECRFHLKSFPIIFPSMFLLRLQTYLLNSRASVSIRAWIVSDILFLYRSNHISVPNIPIYKPYHTTQINI